MPDRAHVSSLEALEFFRASLILYVSKARPTLEEASSEVVRTRTWLQNEQRTHWESQVRRRTKELEQAQQALSSARLSDLREASSAEQRAVQRAKRAVEEAEAKLKLLKHWNREFDSRIDPLVKQLAKLHTLLSHDMVKAAAYLAQAMDTLAAYADVAPPSAGTATAPAQPSEPSSSQPSPPAAGGEGEGPATSAPSSPSAVAMRSGGETS